MPDVSYHGWTHRPKAMGGTDPIPVTPFQMPFVRGFFSNKTLTDVDTFALTVLSGSDQSGYPGLLDTLTLVEGSDGTDPLFLNEDDDAVLAATLRAGVHSYLLHYDVSLKINSAFDGRIDIWLKEAKWNGVGMDVASSIAHNEIVAAANGSWTVRHSGLAWLDTDIETEPPTVNGSANLSIHMRQDSGSSQTIAYGGVLIAVLSSSPEQP